MFERNTVYFMPYSILKQLRNALGLVPGEDQTSLKDPGRANLWLQVSRRGFGSVLKTRASWSLQLNGAFQLARKTAVSQAAHALGFLQDIKTGDQEFDKKILVHATSPLVALLVLDRYTRDRILKLARSASFFSINHSGLELGFPLASTPNPVALVQATQTLCHRMQDLHDLRRDESCQERLIYLFHDEIHEGTKRVILKLLLQDQSAWLPLLRNTTRYKDFSLQLDVALWQENTGPEFIKAMLESDPALHESDGSRNNQGTHVPYKVRLQCVHALGKLGCRSTTPLLRRLYRAYQDQRMRSVILAAFEKFGDNELSPFLVTELTAAPQGLKYQLVKSISTCGTADAIPFLYDLLEDSNPNIPRTLIEHAIRRIRKRDHSGGSGWLTITRPKDAAGNLSLKDDDQSGTLSLNTDID